MKLYEHQAQYYETDQMGIVHHSNYIRWMEEARISLMENIGISYRKMEAEGIMIPVLAVTCEYKSMVHFYDIICIAVKVKQYNGVKMTLEYQMTDKETGILKTTGESRHCFLNREGRPLSLKKHFPDWDKILKNFNLGLRL